MRLRGRKDRSEQLVDREQRERERVAVSWRPARPPIRLESARRHQLALQIELPGIEHLAQQSQILGRGRCDRCQRVAHAQLPSHARCHILRGHARIERGELHLAVDLRCAQDAAIRDHLHGSRARHSPLLSRLPLPPVSRARDVVHLLRKGARAQSRNDERALRMRRDLRRAAAPGQPHLRLRVVAYHRRVDVAVLVDLRAAEKPDLDASALQKELEDVRHPRDHQRSRHERRITDRHGQPLRQRAHGTGLVDEHEPRRVRRAREVAREIRKANPHEHDLAVAAARAPPRPSSSLRPNTSCQ